MKKGAPVFLVIILTAFPGMVKADGFDGGAGALSMSYTFENSNQIDGLEILFGIGLNVPFLFNGKRTGNDKFFPPATFLMIEPVLSAEYSFFSDLLRIRTGAHFGKFLVELGSFCYYAGVSGAFIKDFANDAAAFGVSPEIGVELYLLIVGCRLQVRYDFYTIESYNRFVFTFSLTTWVFGFGL